MNSIPESTTGRGPACRQEDDSGAVLSSKETLRIVKELTAKMFEEEDDKIKAEIQAEYDAQQIHQNDDAGDAPEALPTPMQRQE